MPKFQPNRAKPVSAALYNYLSDGTAKSLDDIYRTISPVVPPEKALRYRSRSKGETQDAANVARKQREVVRIALVVAARDGRIKIEDNMVSLTSETAATWRTFVEAQSATTTEPTVEETSVEAFQVEEPVAVPA